MCSAQSHLEEWAEFLISQPNIDLTVYLFFVIKNSTLKFPIFFLMILLLIVV